MDKNPFEPRLEGAPLLLTLDGKSLSRLSGEPRREFAFLLPLTRTPLVDPLLLDAPDGLADHLARGYVAEPALDRDHRVIRQVGSQGGFFGGVRPWTSRERRADELGLSGEQREWFLYYEAVTWFHRNYSMQTHRGGASADNGASARRRKLKRCCRSSRIATVSFPEPLASAVGREL